MQIVQEQGEGGLEWSHSGNGEKQVNLREIETALTLMNAELMSEGVSAWISGLRNCDCPCSLLSSNSWRSSRLWKKNNKFSQGCDEF